MIDNSLKALETGSDPPIRVGAASVVVNGKIYLWGGRGGKAMTPLDEEGRFWIFDGQSWSQTPAPTGDIPDPRSFHSLAALNVPLLFPFEFSIHVLGHNLFACGMSFLRTIEYFTRLFHPRK